MSTLSNLLSSRFTGQGVPPGGNTSQVLAKTSNTNYDVAWVDPTAGSGVTTGKAIAMSIVFGG